MKTTLRRVIILFVGLIIAHFGVSLFLLANLGSDPFNVMIQGLSRSVADVISPVAGFFLPKSERLINKIVS